MKTAKFRDLIPANVAPAGTVAIGVYNNQGKKLGQFEPQHLTLPETGMLLYRFGAISDVHMLEATQWHDNTSYIDFARVLEYMNGNADFLCIDGDLTQNGTEEQLRAYRTYVQTYAPDIPVYAITGNHESYGGLSLGQTIEGYTGKPLYYSFQQGDDLFIMMGIIGEVTLFDQGQLQWFYETLEANRNRRCFVFMHVYPGADKSEVCGNAKGLYHNYCWSHATQTVVFVSLMAHYKNAILFHGHSHLRLQLQAADCPYANYSRGEGYHSVHIPSVSVPREDADGNGETEVNYEGSEGYLVDVYENGVMLTGWDFIGNMPIPIGTYWLDTSLTEITSGSYVDSTGTVTP